MKYKIAEIFESINGEGLNSGRAALFIRFAGCNLQCSYCDTGWAAAPDSPHTLYSEAQLLDRIKASGLSRLLITGGEPLIQPGILELLTLLLKEFAGTIEIETNGSPDLSTFAQLRREIPGSNANLVFTMDYKLPGSGMEEHNNCRNFNLLGKGDCVKFVVSDREDLKRACIIIEEYRLDETTNVLLSPVWGGIEPLELAEVVVANKYVNTGVQLQLHKLIWDPDERGV